MKLTKTILASLIIISSFQNSFSQVMVVLQSGDTINTRNTYCHGDTVDLTFTDKPDMKIPSSEVYGHYRVEPREPKVFKYLIFTDNLFSVEVDVLPYLVFNSGFNKRTLEGDLILFVDRPKNIGLGTASPDHPLYGTTNSPTIYLQDQSDSLFQVLPPIKGTSRKMQFEILKRKLQGDSVALTRLMSEDFEMDQGDIVSLIRSHNLRQHKYNPSSAIQSKIVIFRRDSRYDDQIKIKVEDQEMEFNMYDELEIELAADSNTKICVSSENEKHCQIIRSSRYFTPYYEIPVGRKGQVDIKLVNERYHNDIKLDYGLKKKVISLGTKELTTSNPID